MTIEDDMNTLLDLNMMVLRIFPKMAPFGGGGKKQKPQTKKRKDRCPDCVGAIPLPTFSASKIIGRGEKIQARRK